MRNKLQTLLLNNQQPIVGAAISCGIETRDGHNFYGISVINSVFRDAIYAEQAALGAALSAGYKPQELTHLYIMAKDYPITYFAREVLAELLQPTTPVTVYFANDQEITISVTELLNKKI